MKTWYDRLANMREFIEGDEVLIPLSKGHNKLEASCKELRKVKKRESDVITCEKQKTPSKHMNILLLN